MNPFCLLKYLWTVIVGKDVLTLLFAGLSVLFAFLAVMVGVLAWRIATITLTYMRGRDLELDNRNGWIEVHKAMVNLRVRREIIMLQQGILAPYLAHDPASAQERVQEYTMASA